MNAHQSQPNTPAWLSGTKGNILVVILLTLLTLITYQGVIDNFFSCDDFAWLRNAMITVNHPANIFTKDIAGWFRPFGHIVFAINYLIFGLNYPLAYQAVSIFFHIVTAYCVFHFTALLLKSRSIGLWAAAFFAIQHLHWEAVAWSAIVAETIALLWLLLALFWFLKWRENSGLSGQARQKSGMRTDRRTDRRYYVLALIALACSYLSAESAVVAPVLLLLTDIMYCPTIWKRRSLRTVVPHLAFWVISFIYVNYELSFLRDGPHLGHEGDYQMGLQFVMVMLRSVLAYIFPKPLLLHMFQDQHARFLPYVYVAWLGLATFAVLAAIVVKAQATYYKDLLYSGLWIGITLLPFCGFTRFTIIDSRHFYPSSVGVSIIFALFLSSLYHAIPKRSGWNNRLQKAALVIFVAGIAVWNIVETWYEDAGFQSYASEPFQLLSLLQTSYAEFPPQSRLYFTGFYTPHNFLADMLFVYYSLSPSQVRYIDAEEFIQFSKEHQFEQPTYLFSSHMGNFYDVTPDQYKYSLPENRILDIGEETAQKYLVEGFSYAETWADTSTTFVWSLGPASTIKVQLPVTETDITMSLRVSPFQSPGLPQQAITIVLDEHVLETIPLDEDFHTYNITIPNDLLSTIVNTIHFRYAYAISPKEASDGKFQDERQIAVAFDHVSFK
jgi:hypothetical protein